MVLNKLNVIFVGPFHHHKKRYFKTGCLILKTCIRVRPFHHWEPIYIGTNSEPVYDERLRDQEDVYNLQIKRRHFGLTIAFIVVLLPLLCQFRNI